jgi:triphosphatase
MPTKLELERTSVSAAALIGLARANARPAMVEPGTRPPTDDAASIGSGASCLMAGMTTAAGFQAITFACLADFRHNRSVLCKGEDPEALHRLRVALRRLRSALSIFRDMLAGEKLAHVRSELRWIAAELDMARELDVLIAGTDDAGMRADLRRARARAQAGAMTALSSRRLRRLMDELVEWITHGNWLRVPLDRRRVEQPLGAFAVQALDRCYRTVERRGQHWKRLDEQDRHRLRLAVKRLRYAAEFFGGLFPGKTAARRRKRFLAALEALQERLGDLHDETAGAALLTRLGIADRRSRRPGRKRMLAEAAKSYELLMEAKPFWNHRPSVFVMTPEVAVQA